MRLRFVICVAMAFASVSPSVGDLSGPTGSVCKQTVSYNTYSNLPVYQTYRVRRNGSYRIKRRLIYKRQYHTQRRVEAVCCTGHQELDDICEPICAPPCSHGQCVRPEVCECDTGYVSHTFTNECIPWCEETCILGNCTAPDTCTCEEGYRLHADGHTCLPLCSKPHVNGHCVGPETYDCNPGYRLEDDGSTCEPVCTSLCTFGKCTAPETCTCNDGYRMNTKGNRCEPVCSSSCANGWCDYPNVCACNSGYTLNSSNECEPNCERPCIHGDCDAPDHCSCEDGYQQSQDDVFICEPSCGRTCNFGTCTAPNTCTCLDGYDISEDTNSTCDPVCNETCVFGECIAPDTCSCYDGYAIISEAEGVCEPLCDSGCPKGICVSPNKCNCDDGYLESWDVTANQSTCVPSCNATCVNGVCASPELCECKPGFLYNRTTTNCDPVCSDECVNGFCQAPDTCTCMDGYMTTSEDASSVCLPFCEACSNGTCVAPNDCRCSEGFIKDWTVNGTCIEICSVDCIHGTCNNGECVCFFGWQGRSCDDPRFCAIWKPLEDTFADNDVNREFPALNDSAANIRDYDSEWTGPSCHVDCLDKINSTFVHSTQSVQNSTRYFFLFDTPCNKNAQEIKAAEPSAMYTAAMTVMGLLIVFLCAGSIVYVIISYRKKKSVFDGGSTQCIYAEDVEDVEDDTIY